MRCRSGKARWRTSRPSQSKRRVVMLEFDTSALRGESPIGLGVVLVAMDVPSRDLVGEERFVGHPAVEALRGKNPQFGLGQVEPAAVLRRVMPLEALDQTTRFIRRERFVK